MSKLYIRFQKVRQIARRPDLSSRRRIDRRGENSDFKAGFLPDVDFVVGINFASSFSLTAVLSELRLAKSSEDRTIPASIAKIKL